MIAEREQRKLAGKWVLTITMRTVESALTYQHNAVRTVLGEYWIKTHFGDLSSNSLILIVLNL